MTWTLVKANRFGGALGGAVLITITSVLIAPQAVDIGGPMKVRTAWLAILAGILVGSLPLSSRYGILERTFSNFRVDRSIRACVFVSALTICLMGHQLMRLAGFSLIQWGILLGCATLVASALVGDRFWLIILTLGLGGIAINFANSSAIVSEWLEGVDALLMSILFAPCVVLYILGADSFPRPSTG